MVEYVRLCFREYVQNSGITERLKALITEKISVNKHSLVDPANLVTHNATTCGLSTGDHGSLHYTDAVAKYIFGIAIQSACRNIPREKLWALCEHLGLLYESTDQRPLTADMDDAIRQFCGQDANSILNHPAFRKTEEGVQMIVYTTRDRSKVILCQFEIGPPHPLADGAPDTFREIEMRSHHTSWRFSLLNSRNDTLHTASLFESVGGRPAKTERAIIEFDVATHDKAYGKLNRFAGKYSAYRVTGGNHTADVARYRTEERRKKRK